MTSYKLFDEFITLQALLKDLRIISSGGAIKPFLANTSVYLNGELENRRGKKIRLNDIVTIPSLDIEITLVEPSNSEMKEHEEDLAEKERVAQIVKKLNKEQTKGQSNKKSSSRKPVRFPGQ